MNLIDPLGLYEDFAGYRREVGGVFRGYYQFIGGLRPDRVMRGMADLYFYGEKCGAARAANKVWSGFVSGYTDAFTTSDPEAFGRSMGNWLLTVSPGLKAIPSPVKTPYGWAVQSFSPTAVGVRNAIIAGEPVYRGGKLGRSLGAEGQFWAIESPVSPGYGARYGVPPGNLPFEFVVQGRPTHGARFVTRSAPSVGINPGGGIEAVFESGSMTLDWFHMP
ncbi:MAG: hypothetical protein AAGU11_21375 [Syntrophobacteraceae bacterium]